VAALANLEQRRADRSSSVIVAQRMPQLSELFSVDSNAVQAALGSAVAQGYVLSSLVSTTFGTNDEGE
jgi:hypothetical protein